MLCNTTMMLMTSHGLLQYW